MTEHPRTFRCPNCNEMINDRMKECCFCRALVDPGVAALIAERQEKANQACSDASYLRVTSIAMFVFLGLSLIPLVPLVYWGFVVTFFVAVVLLIRWQVKFANLLSSDPDYLRAQRSRTIAAILIFVAVPLGFIIRPIWYLIVSIYIDSV